MILYGDLNCPYSYALEVLLERHGLGDGLDWRGVQHIPDAAVPWARPSPVLQGMMDSEIPTLRRRVPGLVIRIPLGLPNTRLGTEAVADALREGGPELARALRRELHEALWHRGRDLSDPRVVDHARGKLGLGPFEARAEVVELADRWQAQWQELPRRMVPMLLADDGAARRGLGDPEALVPFLEAHAAV